MVSKRTHTLEGDKGEMASKKINDSAKENLPKGGRSKFSTSLDDSQKRKI